MNEPLKRGGYVGSRTHYESNTGHQEDTMIDRIITGTAGPRFTYTERAALRSLQATYEPAQHVFTERELAHVRFLRWLVYSSSWNRALDLAEEQETVVTAVQESHGSTQEMLGSTHGRTDVRP